MSKGADLPRLTLGSSGPSGVEPERADAARNRKLLLAAAKTLIDNHGAAAVTMEAVAKEAGVGKGTVFRRFGNRTGLMLALLDHTETELQSAFLTGPPPMGPDAPPLDRLIAYGRARLAMTSAHLDILLEAESSDDVMSHPVWMVSARHVQLLLRQLGLGPRVDVAAVAVQAPLLATSVAHMQNVIGLDITTIGDQWEDLVRRLVD